MYNLFTSQAIYAVLGPKILRFQFFFSSLRTQPTNQPPVRDYDPDTPLLGGLTKKKINFTSLRNQYPCIVDPLKPISEFVEQEQHASVGWAWVFGVELSGGGPLSPTCVNLLKKFGACKTSWEFYEKVIFGLISTVRIQIWPQFVQENSRSWVINLVCLLVQLY